MPWLELLYDAGPLFAVGIWLLSYGRRKGHQWDQLRKPWLWQRVSPNSLGLTAMGLGVLVALQILASGKWAESKSDKLSLPANAEGRFADGAYANDFFRFLLRFGPQWRQIDRSTLANAAKDSVYQKSLQEVQLSMQGHNTESPPSPIANVTIMVERLPSGSAIQNGRNYLEMGATHIRDEAARKRVEYLPDRLVGGITFSVSRVVRTTNDASVHILFLATMKDDCVLLLSAIYAESEGENLIEALFSERPGTAS